MTHPEGFWDIIIEKEVDQGVTNSTTVVDDDELFRALGAGETYYFMATIIYSGIQTADFKGTYEDISATFSNFGVVIGNQSTAFGTTTNRNTVNGFTSGSAFVGTIELNAAAILQFQWAQNTAIAAETTTVHAGSQLLLRRLR